MSDLADKDKAIRDAALALAEALTAGGGDYEVTFDRLDLTSVADAHSRYQYFAHVIDISERVIVGGNIHRNPAPPEDVDGLLKKSL